VTTGGAQQQWIARSERGTVPLMRFIVWVALSLGRPVAKLILYPICLYFLIFSHASRRASRDYLARVLGHKPRLADVYRHYFTFATCALDRVFFLNDQLHLFDLQVHGEQNVLDSWRRGGGLILLGAHLGSFEATRALGRRHGDLRVSLVMYEENARKVQSVLNAINPKLATDVIGLGSPDAMIAVADRLERGDVVGILADRSIAGESQVRLPFLGAPAAFPIGPFLAAALLKRPVLLMFGIYRGGRRYDIYFETLIDLSGPTPQRHGEDAQMAMRLYVERLEHYCRMAPFNWFNFYDFWT